PYGVADLPTNDHSLAGPNMSAAEALEAARAIGVKVEVDGDDLVLEAEQAPPAQMLDALRAHKPEILELLQAERRAVLRHIAPTISNPRRSASALFAAKASG